MKKTIKTIFIICLSLSMLSAIFIYVLYYWGIIYSQNPDTLYRSINVNVVLNSEGNKPLYGRGFFITENKIVMLSREDFDDFEIQARDINGNMYNIVDKKVYKYICIAKTDKNNIQETKYIYGKVKNGDEIQACITKDHIINNYKVVDNHYGPNDSIMCEGVVDGKAGGTAIDKYGRIIGMTIPNGTEHSVFFVIPIHDILKMAKELD